MKRLYRRTKLTTMGDASKLFGGIDKALVAQIEEKPGSKDRNVIVEYWPSQADKDADLEETRARAREAAKPVATQGRERQMPGENGYPPLHMKVIFVRGPQNLMGFVKSVDKHGSYLLASGLKDAAWHGSVAKAQDDIHRIREYDEGKVNPNMAPDFYVLTLESMHPAD